MATPAGLVAWCVEQLRGGFGLDLGEELVQYLLSIENEEEIREYVADLVQGTDGKKKLFVDELIARWQRSCQPTASDPLPLCQKKDDTLEAPRSGDQAKRGRRKGRNKQEAPVHVETNQPTEEVKTPLDLAKAQEVNSGSTSAKKKMKYVNLYTKEGQDKLAVILPGRHPCECLAQKHKLINNCLTCGRIVCEQEGSGPCLFCGTLVCTKEEQDILQRDSNKSQKLRKKLLGGSESSGKGEGGGSKDLLPHQETRLKANLEMAVKHKDKLLEFDRTSVRRTQVIDDESDYFATDSNQWLSKQEREALEKREKELRELRHASRLSMKVTIDFAGRHVQEENSSLAEYHSKLDETIEALQTGTLLKPVRSAEGKHGAPGVLVNPNLLQPAPVWVDQTGLFTHRKTDPSAEARSEADSERSRLRIQDREIQEISDDGWCLSMHQPWASLLVKGIKRVEGRTWYTAVRGRLWIAATAKRPAPQEICELEASYRVLLSKDLEFPKDYPSGCLLGCVNLIDCLSQEQFREQYPQLSQESNSPFVFICSNPQEMVVKFPVKGKHKIWKLDSKIHQGAKKGLMRQKATM